MPTKRGRPRVLTPEQREFNRKQSIIKYRKNNREKYNKIVADWSRRNKDKLRAKYLQRTKIKRGLKKDPFYLGDGHVPVKDREVLIKIAEILSVVCAPKLRCTGSYLKVVNPEFCARVFKSIGWDTHIKDIYTHVPLKILGWKDIRHIPDSKIAETYDLMVAYCKLRWVYKPQVLHVELLNKVRV